MEAQVWVEPSDWTVQVSRLYVDVMLEESTQQLSFHHDQPHGETETSEGLWFLS